MAKWDAFLFFGILYMYIMFFVTRSIWLHVLTPQNSHNVVYYLSTKLTNFTMSVSYSSRNLF